MKNISAETNVTSESIAAVVAAIKGTGPRVDRETYKAHVPKFVTSKGVIVAQNKAPGKPAGTPVTNPTDHQANLMRAITTLASLPITPMAPVMTATPEKPLYREVIKSAEFEPLIFAYEARNWKHFRAHAAALMGDFDPEVDVHIGEKGSLVDRFFDEVYALDGQLRASKDHNPTPTAALLIGLILQSHKTTIESPESKNA